MPRSRQKPQRNQRLRRRLVPPQPVIQMGGLQIGQSEFIPQTVQGMEQGERVGPAGHGDQHPVARQEQGMFRNRAAQCVQQGHGR